MLVTFLIIYYSRNHQSETILKIKWFFLHTPLGMSVI